MKTSTSSSPTLILASSSPFRQKQLYELLGIRAQCIAPEIDESARYDESDAAMARRLSCAKAERVAKSLTKGHIVVAGDQTANYRGGRLRKPETLASARQQLQDLSGETVNFYSGVCALNTATGRQAARVVETRVVFRDLTPAQIRAYIDYDQPVGCLGGFKNESHGIALCRSIASEDPSALTGLPLISLVDLLAEIAGWDVLTCV